ALQSLPGKAGPLPSTVRPGAAAAPVREPGAAGVAPGLIEGQFLALSPRGSTADRGPGPASPLGTAFFLGGLCGSAWIGGGPSAPCRRRSAPVVGFGPAP